MQTVHPNEPQRMDMFKQMETVMRREMADGTYYPCNRKLVRPGFGKKI